MVLVADNVGSPMALDVSCMETSETPVIDPLVDRDLALYCLHEYQEEIHDHLREAEMKLRPKVGFWNYNNCLLILAAAAWFSCHRMCCLLLQMGQHSDNWPRGKGG